MTAQAVTGAEEKFGVYEAARRSGFEHRRLRRAIERGDLRAELIGHVWIIMRSDLQDWIDQYVNHVITG